MRGGAALSWHCDANPPNAQAPCLHPGRLTCIPLPRVVFSRLPTPLSPHPSISLISPQLTSALPAPAIHATNADEYMRLQQRLKRSLQQEHNIRDENEELRLRMKELGVPSGSEGGAPPHLVHTPDASVHAQQPQGASATAGAGGLPRQGSGAGWARTGLAHSNSKGGASPHDKALTQSPTLAHGIATAP